MDDQSNQWSAFTGLSPWVGLALAWMLGVLLGHVWAHAGVWLLVAYGLAVAMLLIGYRRDRSSQRLQGIRGFRGRVVRCWGLLTLVAIAAAWMTLHTSGHRDEDISSFIESSPRLTRVVGVIEGPIQLTDPNQGAFGAFRYQSPSTRFKLKVEAVEVQNRRWPTTGRLLVHMAEADHRPRTGDHVCVTGWLAPFHGPLNPGQLDFRRLMQQHGIAGQISLANHGNCRLLERSSTGGGFARLHRAVSDRASISLRVGMASDPQRLSFLDAILLGQRGGEMGELEDGFRRVGLSHLLSISGAHLAILLGVIWLGCRLFTDSPRRTAVVVLVVLGFYLLVVPPRVPIVRSAIMASVFCLGYATGRQVRALEMLALAALIVLIWRPGDVFDPGFQLSFGVVAGMVTLTQPLSEMIWPQPVATVEVAVRTARQARWLADVVAAHVVAFAVASPVILFHFQRVSPLTIPLSLMAWPLVTAMMAVGYLKIMVGCVAPSIGALLAGPLQYLADTVTGLIEHASTWPLAVIEWRHQPSPAWVLATLAVVVTALMGGFRQRRMALVGAISLCGLWLIQWQPLKVAGGYVWPQDDPPLVRLTMFAVGDGSCYLLRIHEIDQPVTEEVSTATRSRSTRDEHVVMFDCGSQGHPQVGEQAVLPALARLGVTHVDTLILSHADLDHFNGSLSVIDRLGVGRVLMPPQMLDEAQHDHDGATAYLMNQLQARGIQPMPVSRGWSEMRGPVRMDVIWPPADFESPSSNDASLVLSVRAGGRRVLLNGDIQRRAMASLMEGGEDLLADVCDLPHHGSFIREASRWTDAIAPVLVLQSTGPHRLQQDRWTDYFNRHPAARLISARDGMAHVVIGPDGRLTWTTFKGRSVSTEDAPARAGRVAMQGASSLSSP